MDITSYILRIIAAAILCGILRVFLNEKNTVGKIGRLLCGLFMMITLLSPITQLSFKDITWYFEGLTEQAEEYANNGKLSAENSICGIIKEQTAAYILDKADGMGLEIAVEVELNEDHNPIPCGVTISGDASPYAKEIIRSYIEANLGIPKERQIWK